MSDERRRYFRIEDQIILSWQPITSEEKTKGIERFARGEIQYPDLAGMYLGLEADLCDTIQAVSAKDPHIAEALELINRKVNLFIKKIPLDQTTQTLLDEIPQFVNISASGLSFETPSFKNQGQDLKLEIVLLPEKIYILCYAKVVDCTQIENSSNYRMNVDFVAMRDEDTERLVQHIMRKEVEFLRARRKSRQND
jgi:hypothetical protein